MLAITEACGRSATLRSLSLAECGLDLDDAFAVLDMLAAVRRGGPAHDHDLQAQPEALRQGHEGGAGEGGSPGAAPGARAGALRHLRLAGNKLLFWSRVNSELKARPEEYARVAIVGG